MEYGGIQCEESEPRAISTDKAKSYTIYSIQNDLQSCRFPVLPPPEKVRSMYGVLRAIHNYPPKQDCPVIQLTCSNEQCMEVS